MSQHGLLRTTAQHRKPKNRKITTTAAMAPKGTGGSLWSQVSGRKCLRCEKQQRTRMGA